MHRTLHDVEQYKRFRILDFSGTMDLMKSKSVSYQWASTEGKGGGFPPNFFLIFYQNEIFFIIMIIYHIFTVINTDYSGENNLKM